jgi:hypothetical protein
VDSLNYVTLLRITPNKSCRVARESPANDATRA